MMKTFTTAFKTSHGRNELSTSFTTPRDLSLSVSLSQFLLFITVTCSLIITDFSIAKVKKSGRKKHKVRWMSKRAMAIPQVIIELQDQALRECTLRCLSTFLLEKLVTPRLEELQMFRLQQESKSIGTMTNQRETSSKKIAREKRKQGPNIADEQRTTKRKKDIDPNIMKVRGVDKAEEKNSLQKNKDEHVQVHEGKTSNAHGKGFIAMYDAVGWAPKEYNPDNKQPSGGQEPSGGEVAGPKDAYSLQSGFAWDEASGYYYDASSGFYYDGNTGAVKG